MLLLKQSKTFMIDNSGLMSRLDKTKIRAALAGDNRSLLNELIVSDLVGSTNDEVLRRLTKYAEGFVVCVANQQSAGRGRNGRVWHSPANANIYLSVGFKLEQIEVSNIGGLSLVSGVIIARFLQNLGLAPSLKWPNDLMIDEKKLAGILLESRIRGNDAYVIVGVGLNVKMPEEASVNIDQPWTDLHCVLDKKQLLSTGIERNQIVAGLVESFIDGFVEYQSSGFGSFQHDWEKFDLLTGRDITVLAEGEEIRGKVLGVAEDFSLRVKVANEEKNFYAADIKLKL